MKSSTCGFQNTKGVAGSDLLVAMGPTLLVDIGFDPDFAPTSGKRPTLPLTGLRALVDTGATDSCIDAAVASQLHLPVIDQQQRGGIGGKLAVNIYLAHVHVPSLQHTVYGAFAGVNLSEGGMFHQVLIGRTFLRHFQMVYDGLTGEVTITDGLPEALHSALSASSNVLPTREKG